ncbi:MAG: flagellar biosynthetic protein FliR [Holophaga sp.]|nr:flagellar biosynthetic protein FliR [Holophaga sp.]
MPPILDNPAIWALTQGKIVLWLRVMVRVTGLLVTKPGLSQERIPLPVRASLTLMIAVLMTPVIPAALVMPTGMWQMLGLLVAELATGMILGLFVSWIIEAVSFAGHMMDAQMGFSFVQFLDPSSAQTTSISGSILMQLTLLFIFISGLHHQMILALVESYRIVPIGSGIPGNPQMIIVIIGQMLTKGFQLAFPVVLALFFIDVLEGISGRFMPQLQLMQLAFPIKIAAGLSILGVVLREFSAWILPMLEAAPREALRLLR